VRDGADLEAVKKPIIDQIIAAGKLKPELLNRFDGLILFHSLGTEEYKQIARLMLKKLQRRLAEQNINLVLNDALVEAVLAEGVDPDFGARPMARAVQDIVEKKVAEKIIAGALGTGSRVEFSAADFA